MIILKDKNNCCGCGACANRCPHKCISMSYDKDGFIHPEIDTKNCIDCGLCKKVCPVNNKSGKAKEPLDIIAAFNKDDKVRQSSSSGGLFTLFAEWIIDSKGIVFGAAYNEKWEVSHISIEKKEDISKLRGSKYVQSFIGDTYSQAEKELKKGRLVLFTGTPCQIAGLHSFLGRHYNNLILIDVLCHGVPSSRVFQLYIREKSNKKDIYYINMRSKKEGWKNYHFDINEYSVIYKNDTYMEAFLRNLILRPSCYKCLFKNGKSYSDISLGDFWGVKEYHKQIDDDKGLSLVLINTERGKQLFGKLNIDNSTKVLYQEALTLNSGLSGIIRPHRSRSRFFKELQKTANVTELMECMLRPPLWKRVKYTLSTKLYKMIHKL